MDPDIQVMMAALNDAKVKVAVAKATADAANKSLGEAQKAQADAVKAFQDYLSANFPTS